MARIEQIIPTQTSESRSSDLSTYAWSSMGRPPSRPPEINQPLQFTDIYHATSASSDNSILSAAQIRPVIDQASGVRFTTTEQNKRSGQQPDFILGADGKLRANPNKSKRNSDGSINIEIESKKHSAEVDALKLADQLQKAAIKDLINYFRLNNPGAKIPQDWLDQLAQELNLPQAPVPLSGNINTPEESEPPPVAQHAPSEVTQSAQPQLSPQESSPSQSISSGSGGYDSGGGGGGGGGGGFGGGSRSYEGAFSAPQTFSDGSVPSFTQGTTYDGAQPADLATAAANAKIVANVAREMGIDPVTAVAVMLVESGGNHKAVGDNGSSFGLFQLHRGGELGNLTPEQAFDPVVNARVALAEFQRLESKYSDPGQLAAASQRPADASNYAQKVDATLPDARRLLAEADTITANAPEPGSFNANLVAAIFRQDEKMTGTGRCAEAVQVALQECGYPQFIGCGHAWDMLGPLKASGQFVQIAESQAKPGDLIVRPPAPGGSVYGDISVVTKKEGSQLTQSNDATYPFDPANPRYGGKAVFLRHTGGDSTVASTTHSGHQQTGHRDSAHQSTEGVRHENAAEKFIAKNSEHRGSEHGSSAHKNKNKHTA